MKPLPEYYGRLEVITGPMYSLKTTTLMDRIRKELLAGRRSIIFKPDIDNRYESDLIHSHDGQVMHANSIVTSDPNEILETVYPHSGYDVVAIDEGQFFDESIVDVCVELADRGHRVMVAGVDMDYRGQPFEPMNSLMAVAERVDKLTAVCFECGNLAHMIQRFRNDRLSHWDEPTVIVGSNEKGDEYTYEARCRRCYITPPRKITGGKK